MKKNTWIIIGIISGAIGIIASVVICLYSLLPGEPHNMPIMPADTPATLEKRSSYWMELSGKRYYLREDGKVATGWVDMGDQRYYFDPDGNMHTGWLELDGNRYYFKEDGTMARGQVTLDGVNHFFMASGKYVLLVNRVNPVPADYQTEMVTVENLKISVDAAEALQEMLTAARAEGHPCSMTSIYRSYAEQKYIWDRRVGIFMNEDGYDYNTACRLAANSIMTPGHSEHQTGLAIDFNDSQKGSINWLRDNAWKYGFILRYPPNKTHKTDVMYEPWHYRYVGTELAKELYESGLCMEEYMEQLTEQYT